VRDGTNNGAHAALFGRSVSIVKASRCYSAGLGFLWSFQPLGSAAMSGAAEVANASPPTGEAGSRKV